MLWLSDDDGDPPWWMWFAMTSLLVGSAVVIGHGWHHRSTFGVGHIMLTYAARTLLMGCVFWFAARLWFWFDKS